MNLTAWSSFGRNTVSVTVLVLCMAGRSEAQWKVAPRPANQLSVDVSPTVTFNATTGFYEYDYQLVSAPSSAQKIVVFALRIASGVATATSPAGWTFAGYKGRPILEWAATEAVAEPPGFVDDGSVPLAAHSISPGASKSGFKLVSPHPPGKVTYYVKGEVPLPMVAAGIDPDDLPAFDDDIEVDSVNGTTIGPVPLVGLLNRPFAEPIKR